MDFQILDFIQTHMRTPFLDSFFTRITHLGDAGTVWILIAVILLFTKKYRKAGLDADRYANRQHHRGPDHQTSDRQGKTFYLPGYQTADPASRPLFISVRTFRILVRRGSIFVLIRQKAGDPSFCPGSADRIQQAVPVCTLSYRCPRRYFTGYSLRSLCVPCFSTQWIRQ